MKSRKTIISATLLLTFFTTAIVAQVSSNDYLVLKKEQVNVHKSGKSEVISEKIELSNGSTVSTNGIVTLKNGTEKQLAEGQKLTLDGFLIAADGRLVTLEDHVTLQRGVVTLVKNGVSTPSPAGVTLSDGTRVLPRGVIIQPNGKRSRLLDGQMLNLGGGTLPANDFITVKNGGVVIQKDGAIYKLRGRRTMMMADGTKVFSTGLILNRNGAKTRLKEGQRFNLDGAQ